jgi:hypothetical protein
MASNAASLMASAESTTFGVTLATFLDVSESCSLHPAHSKNPDSPSANPIFHPFRFATHVSRIACMTSTP